jgi:lysyl-tRNA synthetase class 2
MDRLIMYLTNNPSIQEVLFFPQMRPEIVAPKIELSEIESTLFDCMKNEKEMLLADLRSKVDMSNKQWDSSIKTLTKNNLLKVSKEDDILYIRLV